MYLKTSFGKGCLLLKYHIWYIGYNIARVLECLNHFKYLRPKVTNPKISVLLKVKTISLHCFFETIFLFWLNIGFWLDLFFGYICLMLKLSGYLHHSVLSYKSIHSWIFTDQSNPRLTCPSDAVHLILDSIWYCWSAHHITWDMI